MRVVSKTEAKAAGLKWFFTAEPCLHGHIAERQVSNNGCRVCNGERFKRWYERRGHATANERRRSWRDRNKQRDRATKKAWNAAHPEQKIGQAVRSHNWYLANKEKSRAAHDRWVQRNPEAATRAIRNWNIRNPDRVCIAQTRRRSAKMQRTPAWADHEQIAAVYAECARRRKAGENAVVDHYFPLRGRLVSGLHVYANLQIIDSSANRRKWANLPLGE